MSAQHPPKNGDGRFVQTVVSPGSNHAQPAARISEGCTAGRSRADFEPKHELRKTTPHSCPFVPIRGSNNTPREAPSRQISGWKARAAFIRADSCSFVVQKTPLAKPLQDKSPAGKPDLHSFVSIRVHSWFKTPLAKPLRDKSRAGKHELHSFVPIRVHSWFKTPLAKPLRDKSRAGKPDLHSFVSIRVHSWFKTGGGQPPHRSQLFSVDRTAVAACFRAGRLGFRAGRQSLKHPLLGRSTRPRTRPVKSPRNRF